MKIVYCEKWWGARREPVGLLSEHSARQRHVNRQSYVAIVAEVDLPRFVIDVSDKWVSVDFLDSLMRKYLSYNFKEIQSGRIFLKSAHFWEYTGDDYSPLSSTLFNFQENGGVTISLNEGMREFDTTSPVDGNWDSYPDFGEYASLCAEQRTSQYKESALRRGGTQRG